MAKHHLIISGTGRAGTTFLVQLFTALGLDTGFSDAMPEIDGRSNAGLEWNHLDPEAPYVIKSTWLCSGLDKLLDEADMVIDHAYVPVRDLYSAAESRRAVTKKFDASQYPFGVPGGLWYAYYPKQQEAGLEQQLYNLIYTLAKRDIPTTLLHFPRFIDDPEYLYSKLGFALGRLGREVGYEQFLQAFKSVAKPELVHVFPAASPKPEP